MQIIDLTEFRDEEGLITLENRIRGTMRFGFSWYGDIQAQEVVTRKLQSVLSDDHMLLLNAPLVGTDVLAPMILFSPQGVRLLYPTPKKGTFRAQNDQWMSYSRGQFTPKKPNMQFRALAFARGLLRYFESQGFPLPDLEAVLLFTNPQTHVDTVSPQARIVLADAFEHFASKILEGDTIMDQEDIHMLVDSLLNPKEPEIEEEGEVQVDEAGEEIFESEALRPREERQDLKPQRRFGSFTTRQWIVLAVLGVFQLILMLAIAFIVLGDAIF